MSSDPRPDNPEDRAVVSRFVLVAVTVPVLLTVIATAIQLVAVRTVPDPVAIHWGPGGRPDGFAAPIWTILMAVLVTLVIPLLLALMALPGLRRGDRGPSYRALGALATGLSTLGAVLMTWQLLMQSGLDDAREAPSVWAPMIAGFACAAAAGALAWFVQPAQRPHSPATAPAERLPLGDRERLVWTRETSMPALPLALLSALALAAAVAAVVSWFTAPDRLLAVILTITAVVIAAALATTTVFRVRVDETGLHVTSALGLPRFHVPLDEVVAVSHTSVNPMGEFGGWGVRTVPGRFGVVIRTGEAIQVDRRSGRQFVVTVDDAATGAAALRTLADRAAHEPRGN